jgi:hypothetical protein
MRAVRLEDQEGIEQFLGLPSVRHKHTVNLQKFGWSLEKVVNKPYLGVAYVSENKEGITGFIMATIEYADVYQGEVYWIVAAVGINDNMEKENNEWFKSEITKSPTYIGVRAPYYPRHYPRLAETLFPVFNLEESMFEIWRAKL